MVFGLVELLGEGTIVVALVEVSLAVVEVGRWKVEICGCRRGTERGPFAALLPLSYDRRR